MANKINNDAAREAGHKSQLNVEALIGILSLVIDTAILVAVLIR